MIHKKLPSVFISIFDKISWKEIIGALFVLTGIYFFRHNAGELHDVGKLIQQSDPIWMSLGLVLILVYVALMSLMYHFSFRAVGEKVPFKVLIQLFLRRNLMGVFMPAGGFTSLAFFSAAVEKEGISKTKIHFASAIWGFASMASVFFVAIPAIAYLALYRQVGLAEELGIGILGLILIVFVWIGYSLYQKGWAYVQIHRFAPGIEIVMDEIRYSKQFSRKDLIWVLIVSIAVELVGVAHLYIAMAALHGIPLLAAAFLGYVVATVLLVTSPFLKGLGLIEVSLSYVLHGYGFSLQESVSIMLLFRGFEFWAPLFMGALSFVTRKDHVFLRVTPAAMLFILGAIDILSVLTPAIHSRLLWIKSFVPLSLIHVSNYAVLAAGILIVLTAASLIRGQRNAWRIAVGLTFISIIGNLTKAVDYEEAAFGFCVLCLLWYSRKQYQLNPNPHLQRIGVLTAVVALISALIYGVIGFYFLDKKHFAIDFSVTQAFVYALDNFFLLNVQGLQPMTIFGKEFLISLNILGLSSLLFLGFTLVKPWLFDDPESEDKDFARAQDILKMYGQSAVDHFKLQPDKQFYFGKNEVGFVAFKIADGYAIALEEPVCKDADSKKIILNEFDAYCRDNNLRPAYYRVNEESLSLFEQMKKKALSIGQEALVDLSQFSLEGKERKSMRNAMSSIQKKGFEVKVSPAPQTDGMMQKLKAVSDEWLNLTDRKELVFSQGMFDWQEIKQQEVIVLQNKEEKIFAFLNIIPDYTKGEGTYDLIRRTDDAPGGNMDVLLITLIQHLQEKGYSFLNMGLVPLSGIQKSKNLPERLMRFAYHKIRSFRHYRGLRDFKEKYATSWENKYLVYDNDFDLISLPSALGKVMQTS